MRNSSTPRETLERLLPDSDDRMAVIRQLVASIDHANALAPRAWALTQLGNGFRLNVGPVECFVFYGDTIRLNCVGVAGIQPFDTPYFHDTTYASVPRPHCTFLGPVGEFKKLSEDVLKAHREFITKAATRKSGAPRAGTPFSNSHNSDLCDYARHLTAGFSTNLPVR